MLKGKTVVLGVTGSIAAYKAANVASMLKKLNCNVQVIMTKNAENFINPIVFETLTGNKCLVDTFDRSFQYNVEHVALAKQADLVVIAPASANIIAKCAHGIADDMLSTTVLACTCKKLIAPAMNTRMYENQITQDNINILEDYGFGIIEPAIGMLACRDVGRGKFPDEKIIIEHILHEIGLKKDMIGLNVLVTAGPTKESIDPVRFISNHSSGKMGYAIAKNCMLRGANVTLVTGETSLEPPLFVNTLKITSAKEMFEAVKSVSDSQDIIIKAAAVADYKPQIVSDNKIKKSDSEICLALERTDDILKYLGDNKKNGQFLCGFSMETENMVENSKVKLIKKNLDIIVANNLKQEGAGFKTDTNIVTIISKENVSNLPILSKDDTAAAVVSEIMRIRK